MAAQLLKPTHWIIVDDGSTDTTPDILRRFSQKHKFIEVVRRPAGQPRQPGPAVVRAFNEGYGRVKHLTHDLVVKLDCDLSFEPDYFSQLISRLETNPTLGIASGVYLEAADGLNWKKVAMPPYHAAGASKVIRRQCFEQIGGFVPSRGWDTIDEIRAMAYGWQTRHFDDLAMKHWKREGVGIGTVRTHCMHGEIYYLVGGSPSFFMLKALHRFTCRPIVIGGLALVWGYLRAIATGKKRLATEEEAHLYRSLLRRRLGYGT